jgi:hypothetical protein
MESSIHAIAKEPMLTRNRAAQSSVMPQSPKQQIACAAFSKDVKIPQNRLTTVQLEDIP